MSNGKVGITFEYQSQVKVSAVFSPDLVRLLGLQADDTHGSGEDVISERNPNLTSNIRSVYVYCDLLEHVPVGNTKEPLLPVVNKPNEFEGTIL